jgi:hypothetical protein
MDMHDIFEMSRGNGILRIAGEIAKKFHVRKEPVIFENFDDFSREFEKICKDNSFDKLFQHFEAGYFVRVQSYLARLAGHFCRLEGKHKVEEKHYKRALHLAPLLVRNLKECFLTPSAYKIYDLFQIQGKRQIDIAKELGFSRAYISKTITELRLKGFITPSEDQQKEYEENLKDPEFVKEMEKEAVQVTEENGQ